MTKKTPLKPEVGGSWGVEGRCYCSTGDTCRSTLVKNPM